MLDDDDMRGANGDDIPIARHVCEICGAVDRVCYARGDDHWYCREHDPEQQGLEGTV